MRRADDSVIAREVYVDRSTLTHHATALTTGADGSRDRLVGSDCVAGCFELALFQVTVREHLEEDGEEDEAAVGPANDFPREAVKETDLVVHDWGWASLLTVRACAVFHASVAPQRVIHGRLTGDRFRDQVACRLILPVCCEVDP